MATREDNRFVLYKTQFQGSKEGAYPQLHRIPRYPQEQVAWFVTRQEGKCLHSESAIFKAVMLMTGQGQVVQTKLVCKKQEFLEVIGSKTGD